MARHVTKEEKATIRRLRGEEKMTFREIGIEIGCSAITAGRVCNPVVEGNREYRRQLPRKFPPPEFTFSWCKNQRALGKSTNQMAKEQDVSPRIMRRWIRDLGLLTNESANPRLVRRHQAFSKAMRYVNTLKVYPTGKEIEGMAARLSPFHVKDLEEMIATRPYRGLECLRRRS